MAFRHSETRWWDDPNMPGHGTLMILMHDPDIGPAVGGLHSPEAIDAMVKAGLEAGGKEGIELLADAIVAAEAYKRKLTAIHEDLHEKIEAKLDEVEAVAGNAFATLRARCDAQTAKLSELQKENAVHTESIALLEADIEKHVETIAVLKGESPEEVKASEATPAEPAAP